MKKPVITLLLLVCLATAMAQSFEGTVLYKTAYKSKLPSVSDQQFKDMMGTEMKWSIKGASYRSDVNGTLMQWQLYVDDENKLYTKMANSEAAIWNDALLNPDEVISSELHPGAEEILGYKCDELVLNCKSGVQKYYFSSKFPLDAKLFTRHNFGNWYAFLSKSHAMPLKTIVDTPQFTAESIAVDIKPGKLDSSLFDLPAGLVTRKSPY